MPTSLQGYKGEVGLLKHVDSLIVVRKGRRQRPIGIFFVSFVMGSCRVYSPPTPSMSLKCTSTVSRELQCHHLISHSSCLIFVLSCLPWQHCFSPCASCVAAVSLLSLERKDCTVTLIEPPVIDPCICVIIVICS